PAGVRLRKFLRPHKLDYYYFVYVDEGTATYQADLKDVTLTDGQLIFGVPNEVFANPTKTDHCLHYKLGFDASTLALLPGRYPFLMNPLQSNRIVFNSASQQRVKAVFSILFQLIHGTGKETDPAIILAHLNSLLTELNSAYFEGASDDIITDRRLHQYAAFKLIVESQLTEIHDVSTIAGKLSTTPGQLYSIVKEFSGVSPKEWITKRVILEAQKKLQYSPVSVKELAYELGFNDPNYFSRLFKKTTGKSVRQFMTDVQDLSRK
ncbi:MAG: helix-turn-helix domain-containing protein, partial [Chitinophagaceae bacterium]